jgi:hypothetical protein
VRYRYGGNILCTEVQQYLNASVNEGSCEKELDVLLVCVIGEG